MGEVRYLVKNQHKGRTVFDGDVNYMSTDKNFNYSYYKDNSGKRFKTRPYAQYTAMKGRCDLNGSYQKKFKTYAGVILDSHFESFDNWFDWAIEQEGFMCEDENGNIFEIDKDLLGDGKIYSPESCCFIPRKLNTALHLCKNEVRGVRVTSAGTYCVIYADSKNVTVGTLSEAQNLAHKRDMDILSSYIILYEDYLDVCVKEMFLDKLENLKERSSELSVQASEDQNLKNRLRLLNKKLDGLRIVQPRGDFPSNIQAKYVKDKIKYFVRINYGGKAFGDYRTWFYNLSEAELFLIEQKLKILDLLEKEFSDVVWSECLKIKFKEISQNLKDQEIMMLSGCF